MGIIIFSAVICVLLWAMYIFFIVLEQKIQIFEEKLISVFVSRNDVFPSLYELCKWNIIRHEEIFREVVELRKKEFIMVWVSTSLEAFLELESKLHHEMNFIFQICNKNPEILGNKNFLYVRDIVIDKSHEISILMKKYRKIIEIYNNFISIKNYTLIGYILPFQKKALL